jgi:hypothetical protein
VVSGIADTALAPAPAAAETARLLETLMRGPDRRNDE